MERSPPLADGTDGPPSLPQVGVDLVSGGSLTALSHLGLDALLLVHIQDQLSLFLSILKAYGASSPEDDVGSASSQEEILSSLHDNVVEDISAPFAAPDVPLPLRRPVPHFYRLSFPR